MRKIKEQQARAGIGLLIKDKRRKKGMDQRELAKGAGISTTFLSLIENGWKFPSYTTLEAISDVLGEDALALISEAQLDGADPTVKLAQSLARLLKSQDHKKLAKLADFLESLSKQRFESEK